MTTYLGEKAVGIGGIKANMNVGKVITDEKTILGDGFTEQLAVNTLLFATSESVAASAEAVRTEFNGKLKAVEDDITNVEDRVRELTKATDGEFVDVKLDVSDLKDADTQIRAEIAGKQDKLTPGENITIEDGVISATGGGAGGDYLPLSGGTLTGTLESNVPNFTNSLKLPGFSVVRQTSSRAVLSLGFATLVGDTNVFRPYLDNSVSLGNSDSKWKNLYVIALNNGADIAIPTTGGTMALKEDIDAAVGDISTALTAILGE